MLGRGALQADGRAGLPGLRASLSLSLLLSLTSALAASGLAELLLQRVVYRTGVHLPRAGAFLEGYELATWSGDIAFRVTAVLLAASAVALAGYLAGTRPITAILLLVVIAANALAWPLHVGAAPALAAAAFVVAAAWTTGEALAARAPVTLRAGAALAGAVLVLGQYRTGLERLGVEAGQVGAVHTAAEAGVVAAALLFALAARGSRTVPIAAAMGAVLTLGLVAAYAREPSTLAIVSLWSTGVTMSLPAPLYFAAFGGVIFAALTWLASPRRAHLAVGLALLFVAGIEPQVLHHGLTALVGLALLSFGYQHGPDFGPLDARSQAGRMTHG